MSDFSSSELLEVLQEKILRDASRAILEFLLFVFGGEGVHHEKAESLVEGFKGPKFFSSYLLNNAVSHLS